MESKHTRAPWGMEMGIALIGGDVLPIAAINNDNEHHEANARLIASAPELLEALKNCVVDAMQNLTKSERLARARYAENAIAKAEGRDL